MLELHGVPCNYIIKNVNLQMWWDLWKCKIRSHWDLRGQRSTAVSTWQFSRTAGVSPSALLGSAWMPQFGMAKEKNSTQLSQKRQKKKKEPDVITPSPISEIKTNQNHPFLGPQPILNLSRCQWSPPEAWVWLGGSRRPDLSAFVSAAAVGDVGHVSSDAPKTAPASSQSAPSYRNRTEDLESIQVEASSLQHQCHFISINGDMFGPICSDTKEIANMNWGSILDDLIIRRAARRNQELI